MGYYGFIYGVFGRLLATDRLILKEGRKLQIVFTREDNYKVTLSYVQV